jgi:hypothetical protein
MGILQPTLKQTGNNSQSCGMPRANFAFGFMVVLPTFRFGSCRLRGTNIILANEESANAPLPGAQAEWRKAAPPGCDCCKWVEVGLGDEASVPTNRKLRTLRKLS